MVDFIIQVSVRVLLSHVARSTEDGYTPPDQVEELQAAVVGVVTSLCGGYSCTVAISTPPIHN